MTTSTDVGGAIGALRTLFEGAPDELWSDDTDVRSELWDQALLGPAREILCRSGKGLRARMVHHAWELAGGHSAGPPDSLPLLIELLHVGSLVIDDIEDDSPRRRGGPAIHRMWGVPVALNVGNWLYFVALAVLSRSGLEPGARLAAYEEVSRCLMRCHQGQALDLSVRVSTLAREEIPGVVATSTRLKTGSLVRLASSLGARSAGASESVVTSVGAYGSEVGIALQMLDDWSGVSVPGRKEKGLEDLRLERLTWPWAWLAETADESEWSSTMDRLRGLPGGDAPDLLRTTMHEQLAAVAPARIRAQLDAAASRLAADFPDSPARDAARADLDELERAFG